GWLRGVDVRGARGRLAGGYGFAVGSPDRRQEPHEPGTAPDAALDAGGPVGVPGRGDRQYPGGEPEPAAHRSPGIRLDPDGDHPHVAGRLAPAARRETRGNARDDGQPAERAPERAWRRDNAITAGEPGLGQPPVAGTPGAGCGVAEDARGGPEQVRPRRQ